MIRRLLPLALLVALPSFALADDTYRVGVAAIDITPTHAIRLNGFGGRRTESEGVYQRIWAKALAIEDASQEPVLLITVDVLGIPDDLRSEVARRLAKKTGLKPERLAITATHTHTGPMLKGANVTLFGVPIPKDHLANIDRYTAEFLDKLEQVGLEALANRAPARLSYGVGRVGFAVNRRTRGGPVDHDLPTLFVRDLNGKVRAVYVSYACHCVTLSHNKLGGDWAGYAQEAIQDAFPGAVALTSVGCGADADPASGVRGDQVEVAALQGREIATEVRRMAGQFCAPVSGPIATKSKILDLPFAPLPTRAEWEERAKRTDAIGHHARVQLEKLDRQEALRTKIAYPVQTWAFGDSLAMAFLPGEVVVDYALRLKRELDGQRLWVNAYANDAPCYIPSERVLKEGGYEGGDAMIYYDQPIRFAAGVEAPIVAAVHEQIGKAFAAKYDAKKTAGSYPQSPQQSLAALRTKPGLVAELVAAEPLLNSPVAIDFGPDGKVWVAEMIDYPQGKAGKFEPGGRIRVLESTRGDGHFDKSTVFLDNIPFPTGITVWRKGVLICSAPDILYAEDTDGDGKADVVKKLFSGFGTDNYQGRVNSLQYGLDGWVYGSCGLFGGTIRSFNGRVYKLGDRDFRIKPDTGELEPATGRTQQGRVRDDWDNWFGCDSGTFIRHYPLADHYVKRNPNVATPNSTVLVAAGPEPGRLYPPKSDQQRFKLSGPPNQVTAACGLGIYRDDLLGKDFTGNAFTCEPVNLVVHRRKLSPLNSTFVGNRAADEMESEFLASTDNWFRPVQAVTGPDGALWVVDMYRFVIEHPRWIPPEEVAKLDVRAGQGMGRLYRIQPKDGARPMIRLDKLDTAGLVAALDSPNGWQRDMATQMLVWKRDSGSTPALEKLARTAERPETRLHTLVVLDAIGSPSQELLWGAITDPHPGVRRAAGRIAEKYVASAPLFGRAILERTADPDAQVRMQAAYSLGAWADGRAAQGLAALAVKYSDDPFLTAAVLSSMNDKNLASVLAAVFESAGASGPPPTLARHLIGLVSAANNAPALAELIGRATVSRDGKYARWQYAIAAGLFDRPERLTSEMRKKLEGMSAAAATLAMDTAADTDDRLEAVPLLARGQRRPDLEPLSTLLAPAAPPALRAAAVAHVGRLHDPSAATLLLDGWKGHPPATKAQILDVLLAQPAFISKLFEAFDAKALSPGEIDAARRQRLLTHADRAIRERAAKAFDGAVNADRVKVLKGYAEVTANGDRDRGKAVFVRVCAACHHLDGVGTNVGPDLAALVNRTPAYLLQEILDPNRNVDSRYVEYQAILKSGRTVAGLLATETATTVILRGQQAKDEAVLRADIEELRSSGKSLMPEGLEKDLPKKDAADLLTFLNSTRPPAKSFPGNAPAIVTADNGRFTLRATQAELYGDTIAFEANFQNLGMWHGLHDRAEWRVSLGKAAEFDVYLDYACDPLSAGNPFVLEGAERFLSGKVASTGSWDQYRRLKIGTVKLPVGASRLIFRPDSVLMNALIDLRTIFLVPPGETPAAATEPREPTDSIEIAKLILDDAQSAEKRAALIARHADQSAALITAMTAGLGMDAKEEYRRIPWVWRVAIAAGKRNDAKELKALLAASLPAAGKPLQHWQAVVIGGGVINGISQTGEWPAKKIAAIVKDDEGLRARWAGALDRAFAMSDDKNVSTGTRYDALRMVAIAPSERAIVRLSKHLAKEADAELQMGAVSGLSDVESPAIAGILLKAIGDLTPENRDLAVAALLRTPERATALLDAIAAGQFQPKWLNAAQRKMLVSHADERVRERAVKVWGK